MLEIEKNRDNPILSCNKCGAKCTSVMKKCLKCLKYMCRRCYSGYCECYPLNGNVNFTTLPTSCSDWNEILNVYKSHMSNCSSHSFLLLDKKEHHNIIRERKVLYSISSFLVLVYIAMLLFPFDKHSLCDTKLEQKTQALTVNQIIPRKEQSLPAVSSTSLKFEINPHYAKGTYVIATRDNKVNLISTNNKIFQVYHSFQTNGVSNLFCFDKKLFSIETNHSVLMLNHQSGKLLHVFKGHKDFISCYYTIGNQFLVTGSWDGSVKIGNLNTYQIIRTINAHPQGVNAVIYIDNGLIASGGMEGQIKLWNIDKGNLERVLIGHAATISSIVYLKNDLLVTSSWDTRIRVWNIKTGKCVYTLCKHKKMILTMIHIRDGIVASGGEDNSIIIWNAVEGKHLLTLNGHTDNVLCLLNLGNGLLASGSKDKTVRIWNIKYGIQIHKLEGHKSIVNSLVDLKDGLLGSVTHDGFTFIWDIMSGQLVDIVEGYKMLRT